MVTPDPHDPFTRIKLYAAEIAGTISVVALLIYALWHELKSLFP